MAFWPKGQHSPAEDTTGALLSQLMTMKLHDLGPIRGPR